MHTLSKEQLKQHRALLMRLRSDGAPHEYIHSKLHILKECFALGLSVHWRAIWLLEVPNNDNWRKL